MNLKPVHVRWSEQATSTHQLAQYFMVFLNDHYSFLLGLNDLEISLHYSLFTVHSSILIV